MDRIWQDNRKQPNYRWILLRGPSLVAEQAAPGIVRRVPTRAGLPAGLGAAVAAAHTTSD